MNKFSLGKTIAVLFFFFIFISSLYFARQFLIPIAFGGLLAILFLPFAKWFENNGIGRTASSLLCVLIFLIVAGGLVLIVSWQVSGLSDDITLLQQRASNFVTEINHYISRSFGIPEEKQRAFIEHQELTSAQNAENIIASIMSSIMNILLNAVLVLIYIFLFMFFRVHIKSFILKIVPETGKNKTDRMINSASKMAQNYLTGTAWMLSLLWIMYTICFSLSGVKYALFFAILCSMLELVPYIGSITGAGFTALISLAQGADSKVIIGIAVSFVVIQIIQTYLLKPLIVNREVNINPLITILVLVAGQLIWGIPGLILAVPILGVVKIFCDNLEPLQPYGFLIGGEKKIRKENRLVRKLNNIFQRKEKSEITSTYN
ncbi:MAG: AI-2E family transporter [Bacteroidia bacterium]